MAGLIKKKLLPEILTILVIAGAISLHAYALSDADYQIRSLNNLNVYYPKNETLGFQIDTYEILFFIDQGNLNGSAGALWASKNYGGSFGFNNAENCNLTINLSDDVGSIRVSGGIYDGRTGYGNGSKIILSPGNNYLFEWSYTIQPFLPFTLLLGLIGIAMMFGGSAWAVHSTQEGEYRTALNGFIVALVGAALIIGWFW